MATFTPLPKVCFWFQQELTSGTMITLDMSTVFQVDLTDGQPAGINCDKNGIWSLNTMNKPIDYTKKKATKVCDK
jgi:hypothetical protein